MLSMMNFYINNNKIKNNLIKYKLLKDLNLDVII